MWAIQQRDAKGCRRTRLLQPTFLLPSLPMPSSGGCSCPDHPCGDPGSRAAESQATSVCANSANKIHLRKVKSRQIFAWCPESRAKHGGRAHKDVDTLGWLAASDAPEWSQPANILGLNRHTRRGYWQAAELWGPLRTCTSAWGTTTPAKCADSH